MCPLLGSLYGFDPSGSGLDMSDLNSLTNDQTMVELSLAQFPSGTKLLSDVFIRLHTDKYIPVGKKGQSAHFEDLHAFRERKVNSVYVPQSFLAPLTESLVEDLKLLSPTPENLDHQIQVLGRAMEMVFKEIEHLGIQERTVETSKLIGRTLKEAVKVSPSLLHLISRLQNLPGTLVQHALMVSALSILVAQELGWANETILEKLCLGGMFHDIGLLKVPKLLLKKAYLEMTLEDKTVYERHPFHGAQMARLVPSLSSDVVSMIYEHHENSVGTGFPRKLDDSKLGPLSKIIAISDQFAELLLPQFNDEEPFKPQQAMNYIENILGQPFNQDCFKAFRSVLQKQEAQKKN